jgi:hypothetical protein
MNVLKNYKLLKKEGYEEYPAIEVMYSDSEVYAELPVCAVPFGIEYTEPVLLSVSQRGFASVAERSILVEQLALNTQKVYFTLDEENNPVISKEQTGLYMRLPVADKPESYMYDYRDGQIFVIAVTGKEETKKE